MQTRRLFINGIEMQLSDRSKIATTHQANNIGELQDRQGTYTNTFRLPLNGYNREKLEHANVMTSATQLPYQKLLITYEQDGIEIFSNAEGIIQNTDQDWIYINAYGGNINLVDAIGDVTIGELFQNETIYPWTFNNVLNSRNSNDYYIYPFIDWRTDEDTFFDTPTVDPSKMLVCCKATSAFDQIEALTGYTFTGSYIASTDHRNMVITPSDFLLNPEFFDDLKIKSEYLRTPANATTPGPVTTTVFFIPQGSGISQNDSPLYLNVDDPGFFFGSYYPAVNEVGVLRVSTVLSLTVDYDGSNPVNSQTKEYWIVVQIKEAGTVIAERTYNHVFLQPSIITQLEQVIDLQTPEFTLLAGVQYFVNIQIYAERHSNAPTVVSYSLSKPGDADYVKFEKSPVNRLVYGNDMRFVDLFRMRTIDVLKDILNLRGLIIQTNAYTKQVSFNYFDDLIKNKPIALDWSHLVDVRQTQLLYKFGSYGQRNNFKFLPNDNVTEGLGDWFFNISDATLEPEIDAVQLAHSATEQTAKYQGSIIPSIEGIETDLNDWKNPGWRILQLQKQPTSYGVTYNDGVQSSVVDTDIPFCRFVGFEELIPEHYEALIGILDQTKVLPLIVKLNPIIIQNLDHTIPIRLNVPQLDVSGEFYINVISNYQGGLTLCEFVRL